jgi:glycosyltransferase involved in cell wall biosynthesis
MVGETMRIAFVSSSLPRRCGIATFTSDLMAATRAADPDLSTWVAAIDEPNVVRPYEREVRWRIRQGHPNSYRAAAAAINDSNVDVVNVQHEFGLYGTWHMAGPENVYEDHLRPFLEELRKPVVTTLHSVPSEPSPSMRETVLSIVEMSQEVVVMAATAVDLLATDYGVREPVIVIPHGMPAIEPHGRIRIKTKLGLQDRTIISTFGLVDPRKGLEYMVEAMPDVIARHPNALYLIAGQTHPNLLRSQGERYRNSLVDTIERLRLRDHAAFIDQYMAQGDIIDLLLATDVYVTPYLDPRQITSGTLAYAMGAGKAIVSTQYLHAKEALGDGRGILIGFRNVEQLASAVNSILASGERKQTLEHMSYAYAREMTWPKLSRRWVELMSRAAAADTTRPLPRDARTGAGRHAGSPA